MARLLSALFAGCLLLFTSACSHYRLGTGVERDFQSIFIAPVQTNAAYPQAAAVLTTQIRETFIRDGRVRVVNTPDEADAVLSVKLSSLQRAKLTSLTSDSGLARKMGLTLSATTNLQDPAGKKTWFTNRAVAVERQIFTDNGSADLQPIQQLQAEYALLPQLAQPFAQEILGSVLDTW
jgi:outer membrane lipopolysaccharide assembly protein LptE/RlpB